MKTQAGSSRVSMSSKKRPIKQSETSRIKVVSKSPPKKNIAFKEFDSNVDTEKSPRKTNITSAKRSMASPIYQGNFDSCKILLIFEVSTQIFKRISWVIEGEHYFILIKIVLKLILIFPLQTE